MIFSISMNSATKLLSEPTTGKQLVASQSVRRKSAVQPCGGMGGDGGGGDGGGGLGAVNASTWSSVVATSSPTSVAVAMAAVSWISASAAVACSTLSKMICISTIRLLPTTSFLFICTLAQLAICM